MEANKRRTIVLIVITISLFLVAIIGATFAYFATTSNVDANIGVNTTTAGTSYTFTASGSDPIMMSVTATDMAEANVSKEKLKSNSSTINVSLASPSDGLSNLCTYDIVWIWDEGSDIYSAPSQNLPIEKDGITYPYELSSKIDSYKENDLSTLTTVGNKITLQKGVTITSTSTEVVNKTHTIETSVYNIPVDQKALFNKRFNANITVENVSCQMSDSKTLASYIKEDVYKGNPNGTAGLYYHDTSLANSANDNTYRYAGADADVNNYVCFFGDDCTNEDNLYRIISVDESGITKIIKATSLGRMPWNSDIVGYTAGTSAQDTAMGLTSGKTYTNIWAIQKADGSYYTSSLNQYLNGEYLSLMQNKTDKIVDTTWSVGGVDKATWENGNVKAFMDVELNNSVTTNGKIGLSYASDYGYAALPEYWTLELGYNRNGLSWLCSSGEWTITRLSDGSTQTLYQEIAGSNTLAIRYSPRSSQPFGVRPVLSLSSSVNITNQNEEGVGTKSKPMLIF